VIDLVKPQLKKLPSPDPFGTVIPQTVNDAQNVYFAIKYPVRIEDVEPNLAFSDFTSARSWCARARVNAQITGLELEATKSKLVFYQGHVLKSDSGTIFNGPYLFYRESKNRETGVLEFSWYLLRFHEGRLDGEQRFLTRESLLDDQRILSRRFTVFTEGGTEYWRRGRLHSELGKSATYIHSKASYRNTMWDAHNSFGVADSMNSYEMHSEKEFYRADIGKHINIEPQFHCLRGLPEIPFDEGAFEWKMTDVGMVLVNNGTPLAVIDQDEITLLPKAYVFDQTNVISEVKRVWRIPSKKESLPVYQKRVIEAVRLLNSKQSVPNAHLIEDIYTDDKQLSKDDYYSLTTDKI
jgi:hypothetical protein